MDNFLELQRQIKEVIAKIEKQIKEKEKQIEFINYSRGDALTSISDMDKSFKDINAKRETLNKVKNKNIIIYMIKEEINSIIKEFNEYIKNKQWGYAFLTIICFLFAIPAGAYVLINAGLEFLPFAGVLVTILFLGGSGGEMLSLHNLKKNYSIEELDSTLEDIKTSLNMKKTNMKEYNAALEQLQKEIQSLKNEKVYYEEELKRIIQARENAVEQIAEPLLNEAYEKVDTSKVTARMRAREKKVGIKE